MHETNLNLRFDVWEALLQFAASVFEDLQCGLCNLLIVHPQAAQQRLKGLGRVERHRVGEGQDLRGVKTLQYSYEHIPTNL